MFLKFDFAALNLARTSTLMMGASIPGSVLLCFLQALSFSFFCPTGISPKGIPNVELQNERHEEGTAKKKNWGQLKTKIAQKSRNSPLLSGGGVGAKGILTKGINWCQSWNQIRTLKECRCYHIYCAQLGQSWFTIVGASVQSLILSPGTLVTMYFTTVVMVIRPTQSIIYVPLQVNRFRKIVLLIVQYKYSKSFSRDFYFPESYPPHKIMLYWFYYSMSLVFHFNLTTLVQKGWQELHRRQASFFVFACSPYDWY